MRKEFFTDKVVIITGSSMGIGKALAFALVERGAKVIINGRNTEQLKNTKEQIEQNGYSVKAISGDMSFLGDAKKLINETIETFGKIDILINNAGLTMKGKIETTNPEVFEKIFRVNFLGKLIPTQLAIPHIRKTEGSIIYSGSIAGLVGLPEYSVYSASKMALIGLIQSLRMELINSNIHIGLNLIGFTENDLNKTYLNELGSKELMPKRNQFKVQAVDKVVSKILINIEKRKKNDIFSGIGKALNIGQRFFPNIIEWILILLYKKKLEK